MPPTSGDLAVALAGLLIDSLPATIKKALVVDSLFTAKIGITPKFWLSLGKDVGADAESLTDVLRAAIDGEVTGMLHLHDGTLEKVNLRRLRGGGVALVLGSKTYSFSNADPLASDRRTRLRAITRILAASPLLPDEEDMWLSIGRERRLTSREYADFMSLVGDTPEVVRTDLQAPRDLNAQKLAVDNLLYFERLVGPRPSSVDFVVYIESELLVARRALHERHPGRSLRRLGFAGLWQYLTPVELTRGLTVDDIKPLLKAEDPYSLLFGFELCQAHIEDGAAIIALGLSFLEKLLLDKEHALNRCKIFSATALISTIMLRRVAGAEAVPLYWARMAALAHAGVLTDALAALPDSDGFLRWASQNFYHVYACYHAVDRRTAPRWRPEWISPEQTYSELLGRVLNLIHVLPTEVRPLKWTTVVDEVVEGLRADGTVFQAFFAGPFDDYRDAAPAFADSEIFRKAEEQLTDATKLSDVSNLFALAYATKCSEKVVSNVLRILDDSCRPLAESREQETVYLGLCAHIAATARSESLANAVIGRCVSELNRAVEGSDTIVVLVNIMLEACAALSKPEAHRKFIGVTIANACFAVNDDDSLAAMEATIDFLGQRERRLIPHLAKARAIARTKRGRL